MKNGILVLSILICQNGFSQQKNDSIKTYISSGIVSSIVSVFPIVSGVAVLMNPPTTISPTIKPILHSTVFFGVGVAIDLHAISCFRRAKYLKIINP